MRIAHLGCKGVPGEGGTERVVQAIALRQASRHEVAVYGDAERGGPGTWNGVRSIPKRVVSGKYAAPVLLSLASAIDALAPRRRYDVVHVHGTENGFVVPLLRCRYPVVVTSHGPAHEREKWPPIARRLMKAIEWVGVRCATRATAVAHNQALELRTRLGCPVAYIPNGVEALPSQPEAARAVLERAGIAEGRFLLFAAARVDPTKGCHTLLEALTMIDDPPQTLIVGDLHHAKGYERRLRDVAQSPEVRGRVSFLPRIDDSSVLGGLLGASRLFVFPSTVEAMSIMLLEVLASGTPVLASDIPENRAVLFPAAATFVAGDAGDLAVKLKDLLAVDAARLRLQAEAGARQVLARFDWDRIASRYESLYDDALRPS